MEHAVSPADNDCSLRLQGVLPHNPLVTHETDTRHLRDPAFLRGALRYRVARLLFTLQLRLRRCADVICYLNVNRGVRPCTDLCTAPLLCTDCVLLLT